VGEAAGTERMTAVEFLAWEREQRAKHEFHRGEVFLMGGGSPRHNYLSTAVAAELRTALRGGDRRVLSSDQRIAAAPGERYVYADVVVVCGDLELEPNTTDVLANPAIVVEVLSPSTERFDRGGKWEAYQLRPSLTDYLLVSQSSARVERFARDDGTWRYRVYGPGDVIELGEGVGVDALYDGAFELPAG